jgi:hypothetical protein
MDEAREIAHPAPMGTIPLDRPRKGLAAEIRALLRTPRTLDELRRLLPEDAADVERSLNGLHGARLVRRLDATTWALGDPKLHPPVKAPRLPTRAEGLEMARAGAYDAPPGMRFERSA